jgi:hypothetical protein
MNCKGPIASSYGHACFLAYDASGLAGYQPRGLAKLLGGSEHFRDDSYGSAGRIRRVSCNGVTPLTRLRVPPEQNEVVYSPVERKVPHDAPLVFADLHCGFRCLAVIFVAQINQRSTLTDKSVSPVPACGQCN